MVFFEGESASAEEDALEEALVGYVRESRRPMFVRKRVEKLAGLLTVRRALQAFGLPRSGAEGVRRLLQAAEGRLAVRHVVRQAKSERVRVDLRDFGLRVGAALQRPFGREVGDDAVGES